MLGAEMGCDFISRNSLMLIIANHQIACQIWDIGGQVRMAFSSLFYLLV
jgi:hypothetical protein